MIDKELQHEIDQLSARMEKLKVLLTKNEVLATIIKGDKGDSVQGPIGPMGPEGKPGKDSFVPGVRGPKGDDGKTPIKGVDYFDGLPGRTPIKGSDYFDGKDGKNGRDGTDGTDGSPDTADQVLKKLTEASDKLDAKYIKNLPQNRWPDGGIGGDHALRWEVPSTVNSTTLSIVNSPRGFTMLIRNGAVQKLNDDYTINGRIFTLINGLVAGETFFAIY